VPKEAETPDPPQDEIAPTLESDLCDGEHQPQQTGADVNAVQTHQTEE
jgi:hypothetical protein